MAINLRQKVTVYFGEDLDSFKGDNISPKGADPNFYHEILDEFGIEGEIRFKSEFDGLIESGIGSSASAAVALVGAINKRLNMGLTLDQIAQKAWWLEVENIKLFGGKQDQWAATYGGVNAMEFHKDQVTVAPLAKGFIEPIMPYLILFYTGENRKSAIIQEGFKELNTHQIKTLNNIKDLAYKAIDPLGKGDIGEVASLMRQNWELKKISNLGVTNERVDKIYTRAMRAGCWAGKILGAGGGGYMLFICPPGRHNGVINALRMMGVQHWDFSVCWNGLEVREIPDAA